MQHNPVGWFEIYVKDMDRATKFYESVLGTKLAHTGNDGVAGALVLSVALLGLGGILVVGAQTVPAASRRRH